MTIRDDTAARSWTPPAPLFEAGWRPTRRRRRVTATDNTGIQHVRLLVDGQERSRVDLGCDYTLPRPCPDAAAAGIGLGGAPIADGTQQVQVVAEDAAGNATTVSTRTVTIDGTGRTRR